MDWRREVRTCGGDVVVYFVVGAIFSCHYCCWEGEEHGGKKSGKVHFFWVEIESEEGVRASEYDGM